MPLDKGATYREARADALQPSPFAGPAEMRAKKMSVLAYGVDALASRMDALAARADARSTRDLIRDLDDYIAKALRAGDKETAEKFRAQQRRLANGESLKDINASLMERFNK